MGGRVELFEFDLPCQHLPFPFLLLRLHRLELGHDLPREQFEALADMFVRVLAGLIQEDDLIDV